ncbi:MAG: hypothetical protein ACPLTR_03975 [Thermacetogeniaceae bacterium]
MERVDFKEIWPELIGLIPVYRDGKGNCTEIRLINRESIYSPVRTKTLLKRLAQFFTFDLKAARKRYSELCGRCYAIPIPLRPGFVLVPVHSRHARFKDDGTRAYLVKAKIASFGRIPSGKGACGKEDTGMRTRLVFTDGSQLDIPHDTDGVRSLLLLAEKLEQEAGFPNIGDLPCRRPTPERRHPSVSECPPFDCIYRFWGPRRDDSE